MTQQFHPTTWVDRQRQGLGGNVFEEILKAADSIRRGQTAKADYRAEQRIAEVHEIKRAASHYDNAVVGGTVMNVQTLCGEKIPTFGQMVHRWKSMQ